MNLSKVMKQKRDAEDRLRRTSPTPVFIETPTGGQEFADPSYSLPQASESVLGGIKAKSVTTETSEVAIDPTTGKLFAPASDVVANGLPQGGTAGQTLAKIDGADYNAQWVETDAQKIKTKAVYISDFTGKNGYFLAYDEANDRFYLKASSGGGGGEFSTSFIFQLVFATIDITLTQTSIPK